MQWARTGTAGILLLSSSVRALGAEPAFRPEEATIAQVQAAYVSGTASATQLVETYLARIQAYDAAGPQLHVVICLNPRALD
ncbi:MAG: amidase, partial [Sinobacteraceae bacterium]|nr:amidase [Nevskiaceae bacterium]